MTSVGEREWWMRGRPLPDGVLQMRFPTRHVSCGKIHDAAGAEVVGRYADCTRWKCPHCGGICDDRPLGWGGNTERIRTGDDL